MFTYRKFDLLKYDRYKIKAYFVVPKKFNMAPGTERVRGAYRLVKTLYYSCIINSRRSNMRRIGLKGFYVTSYQANFAGHHTRDSHVGFLFLHSGIGTGKKMFHNFSFTSYHNTKVQLCHENISIQTRMKLKNLI